MIRRSIYRNPMIVGIHNVRDLRDAYNEAMSGEWAFADVTRCSCCDVRPDETERCK